MREKKILAWHFSRSTLGYDAGNLTVEPGYVYSIAPQEKPELCIVGMHGSINPLDALKYCEGPIASRVQIWGDVQTGTDKLCGRYREVLACADVTRELHRFSCWCVRHTPLKNGGVIWDLLSDPRSRDAIETKEAWLLGEKTDTDLAAAEAAAWDAALAAAEATARDAAWAAAWDAAEAAAWAAALAAADAAAWAAAWAATEDAARAAQNTQLTAFLETAFTMRGGQNGA